MCPETDAQYCTYKGFKRELEVLCVFFLPLIAYAQSINQLCAVLLFFLESVVAGELL